MQYFLNDTILGPYSGKQYGRKGDQVSLIAEHGIMAIVESSVERFPVKLDKLTKHEVEQDPQPLETKEEVRPAYIKPSGRSKKQVPVTNHSNNIQSLF